MDALPSGGLYQAWENAVGFQAAVGSGSKAYLTEDHQMPDRLLCKIVRRRYVGVTQESKKIFLFWPGQIGP